jgi:DNA-binding NtrC family response regulator
MPMDRNSLDRSLSRVLVVEDDAALRTLFMALLTRHGYQVECVRDCDEALHRITRAAYAVVILDLVAAAAGADVLRRINEAEPALLQRTIITTGMAARELARLDCSLAFAVVRKPFDIDDLVAKVHACARGRESRRQHRTRVSSRQLEDDREAKLDRSMRRFASALPELNETFLSSPVCDGEAMLRGEMRRLAGELAQTLAAAAAADADRNRARRYALLGQNALRMAGAHMFVSADEQQH